MSVVVLVDYGVGNLLSVRRALELVGADVHQTSDPADLEIDHPVVLPGVGAFGDCVDELRDRGLLDPLRKAALDGRPFLGVCVGMQLLFEGSEEFGSHEGLGVLPGRVTRIPDTGADGTTHKIPHIGWAELQAPGGVTWEGTPLEGFGSGDTCYFVHSYTADPLDEHRLADCDYDGRLISAAVRSRNLYGMQFHPEKSGPAGLDIMRRFVELT